jgi:hypothetical protein
MAPGDRGVTGLSRHLNEPRNSRTEDTNGGSSAGLASSLLPLAGPLLGGFFVDNLSWR